MEEVYITYEFSNLGKAPADFRGVRFKLKGAMSKCVQTSVGSDELQIGRCTLTETRCCLSVDGGGGGDGFATRTSVTS